MENSKFWKKLTKFIIMTLRSLNCSWTELEQLEDSTCSSSVQILSWNLNKFMNSQQSHEQFLLFMNDGPKQKTTIFFWTGHEQVLELLNKEFVQIVHEQKFDSKSLFFKLEWKIPYRERIGVFVFWMVFPSKTCTQSTESQRFSNSFFTPKLYPWDRSVGPMVCSVSDITVTLTPAPTPCSRSSISEYHIHTGSWFLFLQPQLSIFISLSFTSPTLVGFVALGGEQDPLMT